MPTITHRIPKYRKPDLVSGRGRWQFSGDCGSYYPHPVSSSRSGFSVISSPVSRIFSRKLAETVLRILMSALQYLNSSVLRLIFIAFLIGKDRTTKHCETIFQTFLRASKCVHGCGVSHPFPYPHQKCFVSVTIT